MVLVLYTLALLIQLLLPVARAVAAALRIPRDPREAPPVYLQLLSAWKIEFFSLGYELDFVLRPRKGRSAWKTHDLKN